MSTKETNTSTSSNNGEGGPIVNLTSKEGDLFQIPFAAAKLSNVLLELLNQQEHPPPQQNHNDDHHDHDEESNQSIYMETPRISSEALSKVIEFCTYHTHCEPMKTLQLPFRSSDLKELVQDWYANFVQDMEWKLVLQMVGAANFLDIKPLLQLCCLGVVRRIVGKSAEEVRPMFGIRNPVDGEWEADQLEEVARENEWAVLARSGFIADIMGAQDDKHGNDSH